MQKLGSIVALLFTIGLLAKGQTTKYFEFSINCGHGNWQDTSFIASASDQILIDTVLANLSRPLDQRKFISGNIDYGNGGHNLNAGHRFLWHFIPNKWDLAEVAIEVCDGCPYSDVDADTAYWVGTLGQFCPWSGRPVREVSNPSGINEQVLENEIFLYPNPAKDKFNLKWINSNKFSVIIYNTIGQAFTTVFHPIQNEPIDITFLPNGIYFLKIIEGNKTGIKILIIEGI